MGAMLRPPIYQRRTVPPRSGPKDLEINPSGFEIPADLDDNKANFQFVFDLRFRDANGEPKTLQTVLPGLDTHWECDPSSAEDRTYFRDTIMKPLRPKFDMEKIDDWDKSVFRVLAQNFDAIRIRVFDVSREDRWDRVSKILKSIPSVVTGPYLGVVAAGLSIFGCGGGQESVV